MPSSHRAENAPLPPESPRKTPCPRPANRYLPTDECRASSSLTARLCSSMTAAWIAELGRWAHEMPRPKSVLMISAHWLDEPVTLGATRHGASRVRLLRLSRSVLRGTYPAPGAPELASARRELLSAVGPSRTIRSAGSITAPTFRWWRCTPRPTCRCCRCRSRDGPIVALRARPNAGAAAARGRAHRRERLFDPQPAHDGWAGQSRARPGPPSSTPGPRTPSRAATSMRC